MSKRSERFQKRVELWEARRAGPPPPRRIHRTLIMFLMMAAMLFLVWLLTFGPR